MPARVVLNLSGEQIQELERVRDKSPVPHYRVKAAALLKVADGHSIEWVRLHGLLKPVAWETLNNWIVRYQQEGIAGWKVKAGRGRKPAFSPCGPYAARSAHSGRRGAPSQSTALRY